MCSLISNIVTVKRKGSIWDIAQELNDLLRMMKGFEEKGASVLNFQAPGDKLCRRAYIATTHSQSSIRISSVRKQALIKRFWG